VKVDGEFFRLTPTNQAHIPFYTIQGGGNTVIINSVDPLGVIPLSATDYGG
jgi:hypothetical protein